MPGGIHPPVDVVFAWPSPNAVDPETRPDTIIILAIILGPITVGLLIARLWVRIFLQRNPGWDDWLMLGAMIPTIGLTVLFPLASKRGFDLHVWDAIADTRKVINSRKYVLIIECVFCVASGMIKVSILLFYRRLSSRVVSKAFWWATWLSIGFIVAYSIALTLAPIFGCQPMSAFWDQVDTLRVLSGYTFKCFDEGADVLAASIISVVQDFITALLPTFLYWNLQIPVRQKIALFSIFAIGYVVVAIGCARAYYSYRTFYQTYDVTWSTWDLFLTSMLELHLGCFCANAPSLKVVFKHFFADPNSRFRSRATRKNNLHPSDGTTSTSASKWSSYGASLFSKFSTIMSRTTHTTSRDGYISENRANVSVDAHGGVHVQRDIHVSRSLRTSIASPEANRHVSVNTTDMIYDHYYENIDLGQYPSGHNSKTSTAHSTRAFEGEDLTALPPLPMSPMSTTTVLSTRSALSNIPVVDKEIQTAPAQERDADVDVDVERGERERSATPFPGMNSVQRGTGRGWRSWRKIGENWEL